MVLTTGTPNATDRGCRGAVSNSARAIKAAVNLPLQAQCEPPDDDRLVPAAWHDAGVDTLGMHLEVGHAGGARTRVMPGKASGAGGTLHARLSKRR